MRYLLALLLVLHGLIHLLGFARGSGLASVEALAMPVTTRAAWLWLLAAVGFVGAAALSAMAIRSWVWVAFGAVALSQVLIVGAWGDARAGTLPNVVLGFVIAVVLLGRRPGALRPTFEREAAAALAVLSTDRAPLVTVEDLAPLPAPVRRWLERAGVVNRPRVRNFRLTFDVQMRGAPDDPWMPGTAEQVETFHPPVRLFYMRATRGGIPFEGLHRYAGNEATMDIRLLGLFRVSYLKGAEMTRSETVTLLNDMCLLAPAALLDMPVTWESIDDQSARVRLTNAGHTVEAILTFDANGDLANFTSNDRSKASGDTMVRLPFATPVQRIAVFEGTRVAADGDAQYIEGGVPWTYGRFALTSLAYNVHRPD